MRPRALLILLLTAGLLAGCGGSDRTAQFKKDFTNVNDELVTLGAAVGASVNGAARTPDAILAREFAVFSTHLQAIKRHIDALKPPDDLKTQTSRLSAATGRLIADLRAISLAATQHRPAEARAGAIALVRDSQAAATTRREIARKVGIKVQ